MHLLVRSCHIKPQDGRWYFTRCWLHDLVLHSMEQLDKDKEAGMLDTLTLQERDYVVSMGGSVTLSKKRKRAKSALPAQLEDLDLNNAFFSSTQALQTEEDVPVPSARQQRRLRAQRTAGGAANRKSSALRTAQAVRQSEPEAAQDVPAGRPIADAPEAVSKRHTRSMAGFVTSAPEPQPPQPLQPRKHRRSAAQRTPVAFKASSTRSSPTKVKTRRNGVTTELAEAPSLDEPSTSAPSSATPPLPAADEPLQWGTASPRKRICRPASNPALPAHLSGEFAFPPGPELRVSLGGEAARLQRSFARSLGSPFQGSAAERARARALGGDPDMMFDRLVTRAGMQMPIVRTVLFDAHHFPLPGARRNLRHHQFGRPNRRACELQYATLRHSVREHDFKARRRMLRMSAHVCRAKGGRLGAAHSRPGRAQC